MDDAADETPELEFRELGRPERRALEKLYGGGTMRTVPPAVIDRLLQLHLIETREGGLTAEASRMLSAEVDRLRSFMPRSRAA